PHMSVAENIWIRREPINALGLISHRELKRRTRALLERLRIDIDPEAEVRTLPVAARQMVEIARALSYESQLLIMDEPTSALGERDAEHLFAIIRELKAQGKGILYITHRLEELFEIADELSVLRDGRYVGGGTPATLTREAIVRMMVGRELPPAAPVGEAQRGAVLLAARHLTLERHFRDVSFELHAGGERGLHGDVRAAAGQDARSARADRKSLGRQSAEGPDRPLSAHPAEDPHSRRADARGRRRRQGRDPSAHLAPRR